jgi:hypothetical protein
VSRGHPKDEEGSERLGHLDLAHVGVNNSYVWVVIEHMKRGFLPGKLAVVTLLGLTVFVSAVRPITHPLGEDLTPRYGLIGMSLLSEPPATDSTSLPAPVVTDAHVVELPLVVGLLLFVLKTRRAAFRPVPFRRLKLPAHSAERSLSSD